MGGYEQLKGGLIVSRVEGGRGGRIMGWEGDQLCTLQTTCWCLSSAGEKNEGFVLVDRVRDKVENRYREPMILSDPRSVYVTHSETKAAQVPVLLIRAESQISRAWYTS